MRHFGRFQKGYSRKLAPSEVVEISRPCSERSDNALKVRFSATMGEEPEVELALD